MAYGNCNTCGAGISWDKQKREAMNTRRPLNYDGTVHDCGGGSSRQSQQVAQQKPPVVDQKSVDIKAAQEERRVQHRELITAMQNLTKAIITDIASRRGDEANDIVDSMAYEQYREDKRDFQDEVV